MLVKINISVSLSSYPTRLFHIRIIADFVSDGGFRAVTGIDFRVGGQDCKDLSERMDNLLVGAAIEIGSSDTHAEEGVATESDAFFFAVIGDTARGVTRGVENAQGMAAEGDGVFVGKVSAYGRHLHRQGDTEDIGGLLLHGFHQELVADMRLGFQTELTVDKSVAHTMVEVAVGTEQVDGVQTVVADILGDGDAFFLIHHAAVDDDSLVTLVAHHIAVLGEHITGETLDGNHIGR